MKLIFLPKGDQGFSQGSIFPIMEIPVTGEGAEKTELTDFQWWAPTDKWQQWLKKNPRDWKAESNPYLDLTADQIFEMFDLRGSDPVISFEDFYSILEQEGGEESGISKEEAGKRYTKFLFAYNKLTKENKINLNLDLNTLPKGQKFAFILDLAGENGEDVPETRNAYEIKILQTSENAKFHLAELSQTILTGEVKSDEPITSVFIEVASVVGRAALSGAILIATVGLGAKAAYSIGGRVGLTNVMKKVFPGMAKTGSGAKNLGMLGRTFATAKYYTTSLGGVAPFVKGASQAIKAGNFTAGQVLKMGSLAVGDARAAAGLARATNPVGWIITAVMATQQTYNWLSDKQAPRLGEIEDAGIDAHDSFSPGSIPSGQGITICWTQEPQGGFLSALGSILVTTDTRTTMDIVKLGNFNGKAFFYLVDVHSESLEKIQKENSMILLAFDEGAKFERGFFDNDELELEIIPIKDGTNLAVTTYFQGYCTWDEFKQAYDKSDDKSLEVAPNAPEEYSFHFKYGKNDNIINVTGNLIKDLSSAESVKSTLLTPEEATKPSNESYSFDLSSKVLSYSQFSSLPSSFSVLEAEDKTTSSEASNVYLTETQRIAPYTVEKIEYADKALEDQELPDLLSFIVPNEYLEAEDDSSIKIDPIQDITVKSPKKGTIIIETEEAPEPIPVGGTASDEPEVEVEGGVPVEYTADEVKVKFRDNPDALNAIGIPDVTKIKDKDKDDKIKFVDMITPEEKKDLDIEDWDYIKKVKIYKDGKTGDPIMIKFSSGGITGDRKRKIKAEDANFDTALKVAERIQAGFKDSSKEEDEEK